MTRQAFITSVRIEKGGGAHEYVSVWIRGANVGTLCVREGDAERLALILRGCSCAASYLDRHGEHALGCPLAGLGDRGVVVREATDDEQREAPRRAPADLPLSAGLRYRLTERSRIHAIEAGTGAPAPSRDDASKAGVESRPSGVPPAAGAPPTSTGTHEPGYPRTEGR